VNAKYFIVRDNGDDTYTVMSRTTQAGGVTMPNVHIVTGDPNIELEYAKAENIDGSIVISEDTEKKERKELRDRGKLKMSLSKSVREYINGYNDQKIGVTEAEVIATLTAFGQIDSLLASGSLKSARGLVAAVDITGTIYQEIDRTKFLSYMDELIAQYDATYSI
jgi:hypothetical protein